MGVWANFHGGFLVDFALLSWLTVYVVVEGLHGRINRQGLLLILFGLTLSYAATLLNPSGVGLWTWLIKSLLLSRAEKIPEWAPCTTSFPSQLSSGFM
jgi:hypothetical protein